MKTLNKIVLKIAVISAIISVALLGVVYILEHNSRPDTLEYLVFYYPNWDDKEILWPVDWTDQPVTVRIEKSFEADYCVAWPRDEFLDLSGKIWKYSTDLEQWVVCY